MCDGMYVDVKDFASVIRCTATDGGWDADLADWTWVTEACVYEAGRRD